MDLGNDSDLEKIHPDCPLDDVPGPIVPIQTANILLRFISCGYRKELTDGEIELLIKHLGVFSESIMEYEQKAR